MTKMYAINELANKCGYFYNAYLENGSSYNNGYNCKHPKQTEVQDGNGGCFSWSCPLGYEADEDDFKNLQIDKNGWTEYEEKEFVVVEEAGDKDD